MNLFAPAHAYGTPDDMRRFVDRAHALGLAVILDVVYNHVGASGVKALEGGGLGMLLFLQMWTRAHGIQFKVFDPPAGIRQSLERISSAAAVRIDSLVDLANFASSGQTRAYVLELPF